MRVRPVRYIQLGFDPTWEDAYHPLPSCHRASKFECGLILRTAVGFSIDRRTLKTFNLRTSAPKESGYAMPQREGFSVVKCWRALPPRWFASALVPDRTHMISKRNVQISSHCIKNQFNRWPSM